MGGPKVRSRADRDYNVLATVTVEGTRARRRRVKNFLCYAPKTARLLILIDLWRLLFMIGIFGGDCRGGNNGCFSKNEWPLERACKYWIRRWSLDRVRRE